MQSFCMEKLPYGLSSAKKLYSIYKCRSKERGIVFNLTFSFFLKITSMDCYLCGRPPEQKIFNTKRSNGPYTYNGIDRVENNKGYTNTNVLPCCKKCNSMKGTYSLVEFKKLIRAILEHHT